MSLILHVSLISAIPLGELVGCLETEDGSDVLVVVKDGVFDGRFASPPRRLTLTSQEPTADMARGDVPAPDLTLRPERLPVRVDIGALSQGGVEVPPDGQVVLEVLWLAPCDGEPSLDGPSAAEGTRFGSLEHTLCARLVGQAADGAELEVASIRAGFTDRTELSVGDKTLVFGEIIALGGDFYAHLDDAAREQFEWAWSAPQGSLREWLAGDYRATTLAGDSPRSVEVIRNHILAEGGGFFAEITRLMDNAAGRYPTRRYLALASHNGCHFASQPAGYADDRNEALALYRAYHRRALAEAAAAQATGDRELLRAALAVDAFGCHFLTDLFASGHIRVPRRILGDRFGIVRGALIMAKKMHDEDNHVGLWCTARAQSRPGRRVVWRAYGDGALAKPEAKAHFACVQEAVRVSAAEVFAAFAAAQPPNVGCAADLVPVPLPPGETPTDEDVLPNGYPAPRVRPNHYPLYTILPDGRVAKRAAAPDRDDYTPLETEAPLPAPAPPREFVR